MPARADTFDRANNPVALGTPSDGGTAWQAISGGLGIQANRAYAPGGAGWSVLEGGTADGTVSVVVANVVGGSSIIFRVQNSTNYWQFWYVSGTRYLRRSVAGVVTNVQTVAGAVVNGDTMSVEMSGDNIVCKVNGVQTLTTTDSAHNTRTLHGIAIFHASDTFDNFIFTAVDPPAVGNKGRSLLGVG